MYIVDLTRKEWRLVWKLLTLMLSFSLLPVRACKGWTVWWDSRITFLLKHKCITIMLLVLFSQVNFWVHSSTLLIGPIKTLKKQWVCQYIRRLLNPMHRTAKITWKGHKRNNPIRTYVCKDAILYDTNSHDKCIVIVV